MRRQRLQVFHPGEMPLVLLWLLEERSQNGHQLMVALKKVFPLYRPSPGTVYPALAALRSEGLIEADESGRRGAHRLTPAGADVLEAKREFLAELAGRVSALHRHGEGGLAPVLERFVARAAAAGTRVDIRQVERILDRAALAIERLER